MHDTITVGVPVLAILFGILLNQRGIDTVNGRIDKLDAILNGRIDRLDGTVNGRIDKLEARMEARFNHLEGRIDRIQADLSQFYRSLGKHEARLTTLESTKS